MSSVIEFSTVNQDRAFFDLIQPQYISWEFYSQYLDTEPPFGAIGDIVDCRTYRRFIPELNRRERAVEAFLRVTDYNMSLVAHLQAKTELIAEAKLMFDALFNLKALPSNRSRWVGGTESVRKNPGSIFNCAFTAINRLDSFADIFNLLCLGVGAGYRVFKRDISKLPKIQNKDLKIEFEEYIPLPKSDRVDESRYDYPLDREALVLVGDSREGWGQAIMMLLSILTSEPTIDKVIFNFDSVRPFGERILGFGGKASGYQALQGILQEIHKIITECPDDYLRSIDCMDICCATARGVIAGSSRRCLPKGTLVSTSKGLKAIETVGTNDFVYASDGELYPVKNNFIQGNQNVCKINTNGNPFYATVNHKMAVLTDAKGLYDWKTVAELQPGDRLLQNLFIVDGTPQKLPPKTNQVRPDHSTTCKDFEVPELSSELAWFIGYFFGNGYVNARESGCQLTATMNSDNYELAERVAAGFALFGDNSAKIFKRPNENTLEVRVNNTRLGEYFAEHIKQSKQPLKTPTWILQAEPIIRAAFLAGLVDSDGCICTRPVCVVSTVYEDFVKEVASIYASLGIATRLRVQERPEEGWQTIYHLTLIGFRLDYNMLVATHSWKGALSAQSKGQSGFKVPKDFVKSALKRQQYFTRWDGQKDMNFESYQDVSGGLLPFVPITVDSVDFGVANVETYDIEVETKHEFFANGILTHNSALICLFDEDDELCRNAKTDWKLLEDTGKTYRSQSNNTCCIGSIHYAAFIELLATYPAEEQVLDFLERVKPGKEFFDNAFQVMRTLGEPAIDHFLLMVYKRYLAARKYRPNEDFRLYVDVSTNPCFAPGTMIKTKTGDFAIESLIGKIVDVWDGEQWVTIDNFRVTGENQKVYKVTLWDNVKQEYFYVCTTLSHNFVLADGNKKELKDLVPGHELLFTDISKTHRVYFRALEFDHLAEKVYCCTVPTNNQITLANGLITGNCHEIIGTIGLDKRSGSWCNLTTSDLVKCVKIDNSRLPTYHQISESEVVETYSNSTKYYFDYSEYEQIVRLMVRTGIRQTEVNVPMRGWNETQRKERLLGVDAVNGFQDAIALLGWKFDDENSSDLRKKIRQWANDEADKYSAKLGIERPLLVTCVKPNGNTGAVLGVSSGIHWGWDSHYMRRVTCNAQDSLSKTLLDQGFTAYPANNDSQLGTKLQKMYFDSLSTLVKADIMANIDASKVEAVWVTAYDLIDLKLIQFPTQTLLDYYTTLPKETQLDILNSCNSIVFEFPIKTTANKSCNEVSAIDQLKNQFLFSTEYTDHLPSVTITVKSHEWEDVVDWVFAYWNKGFITASFFSFFEESYPLLANQSISEEEYGKALLDLIENARGVKRLDTAQGTRYAFMLDEDLLNRYESGVGFKEEEDLKVDNCTTGCPIK